jgi:CRP/FNR family cyclic AMP-dependent transcriptional regulator
MPIALEELQAIPYFAPLAPEALARVAAAVRERRCGRGEVLFFEGEPCPGLYYVRAGRVKIYKASPEGREQVLHVLGPGQTFNDVPVFDGGPNPATARTLEPSHVFLVPRELALALVQSDPTVALAVVRVFAGRLRHLTTLVEDLSLRHVTGRVARLLLRTLDPDAPAEHLTQQDMAARVGTAREVVGRALHSLEDAGAIRLERGRITIRDRDALERLA